ncbi:ADP-ribosylglycohydrolase family protein [soil metagenome]
MQSSGNAFADRFIGCLLGMAIGDAQGVAHAYRGGTETMSPASLASYQPRLDADGSVEVPAGQFSLNMELALCLLETLVTSDGFLDPELAIYRFDNAMRQTDLYLVDPREQDAIKFAVDAESFQSGGNSPSTGYPGPVTRAIPIAMVHSLSNLNIALVTREIMRSVLLTDGDPEIVNGALAVAHAVRLVLRDDAPLEVVISEVLSLIDEDNVARALRRGMPSTSPEETGPVVSTAIHAAVEAGGDLEAAIATTGDQGGAAHLTGSIAGAICGAHTGARGIRPELVDGLEGRAYILMASPALLRVAQMRSGLLFQLQIR